MVPPGATLLIAPESDAPPTDSKIRSKNPATSRIFAIMEVAPSSDKPEARSELLTTPVTSAPARAASCTAKRPTPPAAPVISTLCPSREPPWRRVLRAVTPATGSVAALAKLTLSGSTAMRAVGAATRCDQPAPSTHATTRVPFSGPLPSAAGCTMTPATSWPGRHPSGLLANKASSPRFKENAWTSTIASSGIGTGSGTSLSSTGMGADGVFTSASISFSFLFGTLVSRNSTDRSPLLLWSFSLYYQKYRSYTAHFAQ